MNRIQRILWPRSQAWRGGLIVGGVAVVGYGVLIGGRRWSRRGGLCYRDSLISAAMAVTVPSEVPIVIPATHLIVRISAARI